VTGGRARASVLPPDRARSGRPSPARSSRFRLAWLDRPALAWFGRLRVAGLGRSGLTRPVGRRLAGPFAMFLLLAMAACTAEAKSADTAPPFAGCGALAGGSPPAAPVVPDLPDLKLPCFTGGESVGLRELRGPAVINVWASWCDPCRRELPVMQQLADRAGDRLTVLGVDTGDGREAGASFAADKGVTMPTLFDQDRKLINALARTALPITIFVDAAGRSYVNLLPLDAAKLAEMTKTHAGVTVTP